MNKGIIGSGLIVRKQKQNILNHLDFHIAPGVLTGLIGPSGAGKTTLMRVIVGLQIPTSGSLTVNGLPAGHKELRRAVGYVTQDPAIYEDLTVRQNLDYFAGLMGAHNVDEVLDMVDLKPQAKQLCSTLSGGQRARVSLALALLGDPDVLVLDEPTVGLDPVLRQHLWKLFRGFAESGKTIIISSHVMDEAERCDNVLLVRDGKLLWTEGRKELLKETKTTSVEAAFLKKVGEK